MMVPILFPYLSMAQSGLGIIDYSEVAKVISRRKPSLLDTPIIGIIDKGINISHEDLATVLWKNHNEIPDNGIDEDEMVLLMIIMGGILKIIRTTLA